MLEMIFAQILKMSLTAGVCIVVVSMLHLVFHRIPRKYLYALWIVVAFRLICPVSVSTPVGLVLMGNVGQIKQTGVTDELVQSEQEETGDVRKAVDSHVAGTMQGELVVGDGDSVTTVQNNMTDKTAMQDNTTGTAQSTASNVSTDNTANDQSMLPLFSRIWLTGMLLSLIYLLYSYLKTRRRLSHAVLAEDTTSERLIHTGWRLAPVYECDELPSPFAMGIFHPVIYIPFGLDACRQEMILLHEQYHIRRRDHLVKLFASVLLAVYWFHPLVWLSWVILCRDMEMSCDEKVLELLGSEQRKAYSLTLLQFASGESAGYVPLGFGEPNVKSRIKHVLRFKKAAVGTGVVGVVILIATILLLGSNRQQNIRDSANTDTASSTQENADETQSDSSNVSDAATLLYSVKNPYVGDISAD
ncbi:MAG: M56 family metallopeptidase, partial [Clostridia bacterium]